MQRLGLRLARNLPKRHANASAGSSYSFNEAARNLDVMLAGRYMTTRNPRSGLDAIVAEWLRRQT